MKYPTPEPVPARERDLPPFPDEPRVLIIATSMRSGSNLLAGLLYQTGRFGVPAEYLTAESLQGWTERLGTKSASELLRELSGYRTTPNGVFAAKVHFQQLECLGGFAKLMETFPSARFVFLYRRDILAQAVSMAIALQSDQWVKHEKARDQQPVYDEAQIDHCLRKVVLESSSWKYLLAANGFPWMELAYEDLVARKADAIQRVAELMGESLDATAVPIQTVYQKQANARNSEWMERFRASRHLNPLFPGSSPARNLARKVKHWLQGK